MKEFLEILKQRVADNPPNYGDSANVKKKVGQCLKKTRPSALKKNQATWPKNA